jgi:hypothetical protein
MNHRSTSLLLDDRLLGYRFRDRNVQPTFSRKDKIWVEYEKHFSEYIFSSP